MDQIDYIRLIIDSNQPYHQGPRLTPTDCGQEGGHAGRLEAGRCRARWNPIFEELTILSLAQKKGNSFWLIYFLTGIQG